MYQASVGASFEMKDFTNNDKKKITCNQIFTNDKDFTDNKVFTNDKDFTNDRFQNQ